MSIARIEVAPSVQSIETLDRVSKLIEMPRDEAAGRLLDWAIVLSMQGAEIDRLSEKAEENEATLERARELVATQEREYTRARERYKDLKVACKTYREATGLSS